MLQINKNKFQIVRLISKNLLQRIEATICDITNCHNEAKYGQTFIIPLTGVTDIVDLS